MSNYKYLDSLIHSHFHQDFDLIADTIEGLVDDYLNTNTPEDVLNVRNDIAQFLSLSDSDIEKTFKDNYGYDFDPELWGLTAKTFLLKLDTLFKNNN